MRNVIVWALTLATFSDPKRQADTTWQQGNERPDRSPEGALEMPYTRWKMWKRTLLCSGKHQ